MFEAMEAALGQFPEGRDLAAEDIEQWRAPGLVKVEDVVARNRRRVPIAVVEQQPHAPERIQQVLGAQLLF